MSNVDSEVKKAISYRDQPPAYRVAVAMRWALFQRGAQKHEFAADIAFLQKAYDYGAYADQLIHSLEFLGRYGLPAEWDWIEWCYLNLLKRSADEAGIATYTKLLREKPMTRGELAAKFVLCDEFEKTHINTLEILMLYATRLDLPPDAGGLRHWVSRLEAGEEFDRVAADFPPPKRH